MHSLLSIEFSLLCYFFVLNKNIFANCRCAKILVLKISILNTKSAMIFTRRAETKLRMLASAITIKTIDQRCKEV